MSDPLAALRARFLDRCGEDLARLRAFRETEPAPRELRAVIHRLAGTAGVFGYAQVSALALRLDDDLHADIPLDPAEVEALADLLTALTAQRRGAA